MGYDRPESGTHRLRINAEEAETVRYIFRSYLEFGSVYELERQVRDRGITSKLSFSRSGKATGGQPLSRGALFHMLRNRVYLGEITHRDESYSGLHEAIVDGKIFDEVQRMLDAHATRRRSTREHVTASPLAGRIIDADGQSMSPTFAYGKAGRLYRYYVSAPLQQGGRRQMNDDSPRRVSAPRIEGVLTKTLSRLIPGYSETPIDLIARVEVRAGQVVLFLPVTHFADIRDRRESGETAGTDPADHTLCRVALPLRFAIRGGQDRGYRRRAGTA